MLTVIAIVLFNIFFVKKYIGSSLLSDGTHIKHRGKAGMWQPAIATVKIKWHIVC